jgi:hypothetical protein
MDALIILACLYARNKLVYVGLFNNYDLTCLVPWSDCHTYHTVDRVRGSKGNKALRTRKVQFNPEYKYVFLFL